ncbi:hypothetical protein KYE75_07625 [Bifidobacterium pseudocatenulatum]|uniref:hypothetical protein n=1 Tax=Bifidobacterium pseudocatenulatum TaxID=28026 RepID=UPI001CFB2247|nr:hypothetical protein [Bifidobacterium pseudocatenulatum]MCB4878643.1 hypothetical protein [Bifidobacterium pseudocatenulatum]MCB4912372.1 hypothetical protein [Bifidobacterium pseudocatenulatum]UDG91397.1 hypothetical protein KYE75_07625 [Bifidobacterium pseudocatenulatum]
MATITFTTRCTNKTISLPPEEAIERLFADADEWFAFQHRAPETAMEPFAASIYDAEKTTVNPYSTEIEVNGVPMAISIKEDGGIAIRPGEWYSGAYEDLEKTDRTALLADINRMACRPMGAIGAPTLCEAREYGECLWNRED